MAWRSKWQVRSFLVPFWQSETDYREHLQAFQIAHFASHCLSLLYNVVQGLTGVKRQCYTLFMVKAEQQNFRLESEVKAALEKAAAAQDRSVSSYVSIAVREKLEREGFAPTPKKGHKK